MSAHPVPETLALPVFFKESPFQLQIRKESHLVHLAAGFSKSVNPLTGMTVNLVIVQQWMAELRDQADRREWNGFLVALKECHQYFKALCARDFQHESESIAVPTTQFRFFDGSILKLDAAPDQGLQFTFQKSGLTSFPSEDASPVLRLVKVEAAVSTEFELMQAQSFPVPATFSVEGVKNPESVYAHELRQKTSLKLLRIEIWDPLRRIAQVH